MYSSKNQRHNICSCWSIGAFWRFSMFLQVVDHVCYVFLQIFSRLDRLHAPIEDNNTHIETCQKKKNKSKEQLSFWQAEILAWFTMIGITLQYI